MNASHGQWYSDILNMFSPSQHGHANPIAYIQKALLLTEKKKSEKTVPKHNEHSWNYSC